MADKCFHGVPHDQHCIYCDLIQKQAVRCPDSRLRKIAQLRWNQLQKEGAFNRYVLNNGIEE